MKKKSIQKFFMKEQPDICCLGDTRINEESLKELNYHTLFSDHYQSFWNCAKNKKGYSGVAIFTKYRPLNVLYGFEDGGVDEEGRILTLKYADFYISCVYLPNSWSKRLDCRTKEWDLKFHKFVNDLKSKKELIICGDMNVAHQEIDVHNPVESHGHSCFTLEERKNFTNLLLSGYIDTFRHLNPKLSKFSYFSSQGKLKKNKSWRLDYFVINKEAEERLVNSEILTDHSGSGHVPIKLTWIA